MKGKSSISPQAVSSNDLLAAVEEFIAHGGIIHVIPDGKPSSACVNETPAAPGPESNERVEQLKSLLARGAGFSSLQYSLKMNRQEIRQLAQENGLKIPWRRPVIQRRESKDELLGERDRLAGDVMHHASMDLTLREIAETLGITTIVARNIARDYRITVRTASKDE